MRPIFFAYPADLSAWLDPRHADTREVWVGSHKRGSTPGALTYSEALDEARRICWIDGVRRPQTKRAQ